MEKKRSVGVTIFAWLFIIAGITGLLRFGSGLSYCPEVGPELDKSLPAGVCPIVSKDLSYYWNNLLLPLIGLIGGIFLLKLKEWARKLILILCCISLVMTVVGFKAYMKQRNTLEDMIAKSIETAFEQKRQEIIDKYKPEHQKEALEKHSKTMNAMQRFPNVLYSMVCSIIILFILWNLCVIFFFTRPKVKAQFSPESLDSARDALGDGEFIEPRGEDKSKEAV